MSGNRHFGDIRVEKTFESLSLDQEGTLKAKMTSSEFTSEGRESTEDLRIRICVPSL